MNTSAILQLVQLMIIAAGLAFTAYQLWMLRRSLRLNTILGRRQMFLGCVLRFGHLLRTDVH
jgi:hypothetical protein